MVATVVFFAGDLGLALPARAFLGAGFLGVVGTFFAVVALVGALVGVLAVVALVLATTLGATFFALMVTFALVVTDLILEAGLF